MGNGFQTRVLSCHFVNLYFTFALTLSTVIFMASSCVAGVNSYLDLTHLHPVTNQSNFAALRVQKNYAKYSLA